MSQKENIMQKPRIEKVTINCGCGTDHALMEKSLKLLESLTSKKPVKTKSKVRLASWGLRKGLPIGAKVTVRGKDAYHLVKRLVEAKDFALQPTCIDNRGNISFGIAECIDIPGIEYTPEIGIIGLQVSITLGKPGYRVKNRSYLRSKVPQRHLVGNEEAVAFLQSEFKVSLVEKEDEDEE
ncbi:MAG: 50S ribosomal protein L5 [Candidatus Woesearchaeota archaeon]